MIVADGVALREGRRGADNPHAGADRDHRRLHHQTGEGASDRAWPSADGTHVPREDELVAADAAVLHVVRQQHTVAADLRRLPW